MLAEAQQFMKMVQNNLVLEFRKEAAEHFNDRNDNMYGGYRQGKNEELDKEIEEAEEILLSQLKSKDTYSQILLEGMEIVAINENKKRDVEETRGKTNTPKQST